MRTRIGHAALPAAALLVLGLTACSSNGNNTRNATSAPAAASASASAAATRAPATAAAASTANAPTSGSPAAASGTPVAAAQGQRQAQASVPSPASTGVAGDVEQKLIPALISGADLPSGLTVQNARQPLSNKQFAAAQQNPTQFEQQQAASGRISGALLNVSSPDANPPSGVGEPTNLLIVLSAYGSPQQASAALPGLLKLITPTAQDPHSYTIASKVVDIGKFADETAAAYTTITPVLGGRPTSDVWAVGVRRGTVDEVYIYAGVSGAPTTDQVRDLIQRQDARVMQTGL
jgi:hypothetical protein